MRKKLVIAIGTVLALGLSACGSAGGGSNSTAKSTKTAASGADITLGVLTSVTGSASSGFVTVETGVKARLGLENSKGGVNGHKLKYVIGDDTSTAAGAASATQKLIQQDKVYGILDVSSFFSGAAKITKTAGTPVAGVSFNGGPEWHDASYTNIFDSLGYAAYNIAATTTGDFFKARGATKVAAIGYGVSPSSANAAASVVASSVHAGLQKAFLDTSLAFGSTDVGPVVQKIKASGADALYLPVVPNTAFAIIVALKQAGVQMKSVLLATGYGGDLLKSKEALAAADGVDFITAAAPVELNTPGTKTFQDALSTYAGETGVPTFGEYMGWLTADLFIAGLKLAGDNASSAQFITKLRAGTWDGAGGLEKPTNFADLQPVGPGLGPDNCAYFVKLTAGKFVPITGASPACGTVIPGIKIGS